MSEKISNKDIIEGSLLNPTINEAKSLVKGLDLLIVKLKELLDVSKKAAEVSPLSAYDQIKTALKAVDQGKKAVEGLNKAEEERAKIIASVNEQTEKRIKSLSELEKQLIEQRKELNKLNKDAKKQGANIDEIDSKRIKLKAVIQANQIALRNEQKQIKKGLELQGKESELRKRETLERFEQEERIKAETKALRETAKANANVLTEYQKMSKRLNSLKKRYKDLAAQEKENTQEAKALLATITKLDKRLKQIDKTVGESRRSVGEYEKAFKGLKQQIITFAKIGFVFKTLETLSNAFSEGLSSAFSTNSRTGAELEKILGRLTVTLSVLVSRFADALPQIKNFFKDLATGAQRFAIKAELGLLRASNAFGVNDKEIAKLKKQLEGLEFVFDGDKFAKSFEGVGDEISKTIDKNDKLIDTTLAYRRSIAILQESQKELIKSQAELEIKSGDNTISLLERKKATEELAKVQDQLNRLEIDIARKQEELARQRVSTFKDDIGAREDLAAAVIATAEAEAKAITDSANTQKEARDIESDIIERNLDFIIDDFDRRKTINERIIADDTMTFTKRRALLERTKELNERAFKDEEEEINKAAKTRLDFNELVRLEDSKLIADRVQNAGLNDRLAGRALEIIKERIAFNQDLFESERDLNKAEREANLVAQESILIEKALNELNQQGINTEEVLQKLSEDRLQAEINNLKLSIDLLKSKRDIEAKIKGEEIKESEAEINLRKELNEKLLEQAEQQAEKEAKIEEDKLKRQSDARQLALDGARNFAQRSFDNTNENIDRELRALEARETQLRQLAARGVENVEENLALEQKRRAELERKREQQVKRQQRVELVLSALETYSNKTAAGDPNALASTISETSVLISFINSLPTFYTGTDRIGDDSAAMRSGKDGHLVWADSEEMIMNPMESKMIRDSGMSRMQVASLAQLYGSGKISRETKGNNNREVVAELRNVTKAIERKPTPHTDYDSINKAWRDTYITASKREVRRKKNKLWR